MPQSKTLVLALALSLISSAAVAKDSNPDVESQPLTTEKTPAQVMPSPAMLSAEQYQDEKAKLSREKALLEDRKAVLELKRDIEALQQERMMQDMVMGGRSTETSEDADEVTSERVREKRNVLEDMFIHAVLCGDEGCEAQIGFRNGVIPVEKGSELPNGWVVTHVDVLKVSVKQGGKGKTEYIYMPEKKQSGLGIPMAPTGLLPVPYQ